MPSYEPEVIERFAAQLERRARAVRRGLSATGLVLGAFFGSIPLTPLGRAWPIPHVFGFTTLLVGACVGAFIGWVVGDGRAEMYRLHAQTTLCQLHAQRTSLAIWRLLQDRPADQRVAVAAEPAIDFGFDDEPEPEPEPTFELERELEPVLTPAARLVAAPDAYEPEPVAPAPVAPPAPVLPDPLPTQVLQPLVPVSAPAAPAPTPEAAPSPPSTPAPSVPVSAQAAPSFLRPAGAPQPPVSPPPVSG